MWEEQHLTDGCPVGEQHHQPVDAGAKAAVGRHAIAHGPQIILVDGVGLVLARLVEALHLLKARLLVQRVVQFREGVAHLHAGDEKLKALHVPGVPRDTLGQRRDVARVLGNESGLDKTRLDKITQQAVDELAPTGPGRGVAPHRLDRRGQRFRRRVRQIVDLRKLHNRLAQGHALPGSGQVNGLPLVADGRAPVQVLRQVGQHPLGEIHHVMIVPIGGVELHLGEFRVMGGIHAFIAEIAPNLIDALQPAHQQALQVQLKGDAQVQLLL